jgi:hypothetical protein
VAGTHILSSAEEAKVSIERRLMSNGYLLSVKKRKWEQIRIIKEKLAC